MDIIPVLDLKGGHVVRARHGDRASYRPIVTPLAPTSDPVDVARGLFALHPFRRFYIADLDGIEGRGRHDRAIARVREALPETELWVDNGLCDEAACRAWMKQDLGRLVLGSESQTDAALPLRLGAVLSLDFRGEAFVGPPALIADAGLWPDTLIVMTLARVGSGLGPDLRALEAVKARAMEKRIYAAGGVRDGRDVDALREAGVSGALVASALHDGRIGTADFARFGEKSPEGFAAADRRSGR